MKNDVIARAHLYRESDLEGREVAAAYLGATDIKTNALLWAIKIFDCIKCAPGSTAKFNDKHSGARQDAATAPRYRISGFMMRSLARIGAGLKI
jgi:hypothetical protein